MLSTSGYNNKQKSHLSLKKNNHPSFFQPKLTINQPNDIYEQEADAMANHVMQAPGASSNNNSFFKPSSTPVLRKENDDATEVSNQTENYISSLSGGEPLNKKDKTFFESRMGYDLSNVRLHTDSIAAKSARSINALAYTSGNNIVFNQDQYAPETNNGKRLIAHELTHVVQQNAGAVQTKLIQRDPPPAGSPAAPAPAPAPVPSGPPAPSPSLTMPGLTTLVFRYGNFNTTLSLPNSIQASLPVRIRNIGTLTITASSTIPTQFGLSVSLDTINHIRIAGNVAYNADTGVGTAGISVSSMREVCTMRNAEATRANLNSLTNDVKTAVQAFNANNIQSIIALGSAIYGLYDAAHEATERCSMQPVWSISLGAHTQVNPLASNPPAHGTEAGGSFIGATATWHF